MPASRSGLRPDSHARTRIPGWALTASRLRGMSRVLLTGLVVMSLAGASAPMANAAIAKPVLKVSGTTLTWGALSGVSSYVLATIKNPTTTRNTTYQTVTGTSFSPPSVPGQAVNYGLRANVSGAPWAAEVRINWPVALPPAPSLKVSGTTLSWSALSGVSSYTLATIKNPTTTRNTTYQTVTGTSFSPPSVPGQAVNYGLAANVSGAPWSAQVTINWPVPLPPKPALTVSGTTLTWGALSGVSSYTLATIKNPTTTRDTTYQTVTGTSFSPPSVPGQAVNYGLSANVSGAPWASEVTINWPASTATSGTTATTTTTTTTTTSTTPTPPPPTSGGLIVGLNASVSGWADMSGRMGQVASQAGPKWIRQEFDWSQIEPSRGTFDWSRYDQFMLVSAQNGAHVLPDLLDTPSWDGPSWNAIPSNPSDFATFVAAVVGRYGPHGTFWTAHPTLASYAVQTFEVWNEPYYSNGNNGNYDPGAYARLVKAAAIAGRSADSGAKFLLAADNTSALVNSTWVWWIDAVYQAVPDLNSYFDGVAVHPYGDDLTNVSFPTPGVAYNGYNQVRRVESIRQQFVGHGASDKPLWLTEIGWPTCTSGSTRCTTASGQASDLTTVFNYARGSWASYVRAVFVYCFQDNNSNSADPENDYGLVDYNGNTKPALSVFKAQTAMQ